MLKNLAALLIMQKLKRRLAKYSQYLPLFKIIFIIALVLGIVYLTLTLFLPRFFRSFSSITGEIDLAQNQGRVNILFLGIGGHNHIGPDLTDSIIFASIRIKDGQTLLLSIPRDVWIDSMKAKINTAYHYGEEKKKGGGLTLAKAVVSEVVGQPVHYAVVIDFDGFVKIVDLVGGVDIDVERSFDDYKYPIPGMENAEPEERRYEHLHFDKGKQHMDGQRALKYIRSRYAQGEEGTDFARAKRQQKFLLAFKDKIFSPQVLFNPHLIKKLTEVLNNSIITDISSNEHSSFIKLAFKLNRGKIKTATLDEDLLFHPPKNQYENQWVLIPKNGSWKKIHQYVNSLLVKP